ncbi:hypothetical protein FIBSPDRAFT_736333 [Athelia psychrophila]|uniref:Tc1-like transposase DDE domain-containing protein n=1 Tax=Athelia psychrophila TaxID=1759441 RepID=A0A166MKY9_9AGAM|nr:hypothetical protein FIBSPDRAFT_736333 [Fibularhizoctonia sp. CBS 109695]
MNAKQYVSILEESLIGTLKDYKTDPSDIIFQQDGDPKHTSGLARNWLASKHIDMASHPAQSPDMSIIEHAWNEVDRQLRARFPLPKNVEELWEVLQEEWASLDIGYITSLYESMPRRVAAVIETKGGHTRY